MTEPLLSSTAPVFKIAGEVKQELGRDLTQLTVEETTEGLKTLVARFRALGPPAAAGGEDELLYLDGQILDFGKELEVSIGAPGSERTIFKGLISGLEASFLEASEPEVLCFAEDKLMKLRMTRRSKKYEQVSDADIASAIANQHGMTPEAQADGPTYDVVHQWNQSDLAFLRDRARMVQAEVWFLDDKLHFKTRGNRTGTELTLTQGNELIELQVRADLAHQRTKVKVSGYDAQARDKIDEESGSDAIQSEASSGKSGPDTLQRAFGERVSYRTREVALVSAEATAWAKAEMLRRSRGFVTATGTTRGSPDMIVGSKLTLQRVGAPFTGANYYVTHVRHTYDLSHGHRTWFEAERPTVNEASR